MAAKKDATHVLYIFTPLHVALQVPLLDETIAAFMIDANGHRVIVNDGDNEPLVFKFWNDADHLAAQVHPAARTFFFKSRYSDKYVQLGINRIVSRITALLTVDYPGVRCSSQLVRVIEHASMHGH